MRPVQPYRRRTSVSFWLGLLLVLLVVTGAVGGVLMLLGVNINPFAGGEDPYMVRIPINSQAIPAYQRVTREHMLNPSTRSLMYQPIPPDATVGMGIIGVAADGSHVEGRVEAVRNVDDQVVFVVEGGHEVAQRDTFELGGAVMQVNAIIGRVVKKDKRAGLGFKEDSFFPRGTPEGIAGATPVGMRAVTLDATKLTGVHALNAGDRIDLIANVPTGEVAAFNSQYRSRLPGAALVASSSREKPQDATEPVMLAQDAVVLKPVYVRNETTTSMSLTQGTQLQNVPKYEVAIAVTPDDVIPLQGALSKSIAITCIAHSMQSESSETTDQETLASTDRLRIPVTVRPILAYGVVTRDAFVSPATRKIRSELLSRQDIDRLGVITSMRAAVGAVARRDIPAGSFLRKSDLLTTSLQPRDESPRPANSEQNPSKQDQSAVNAPRDDMRFVSMRQAQPHQHDHNHAPVVASAPPVIGDRPAITRFVPPGRTAFAIPWNRMYGAEHLTIGDEIDLLASFSLESNEEEEETETRPDGTKIVRKRNVVTSRETLRTWDETFGNRAEPWFVASGALVVGPVGYPPPAPAQRALGENLTKTSGAASRGALNGLPVIVAVDQRDVEAVAAALATKEALFTPAFHPSTQTESAEGRKEIAIAAQNVEAYEQLTETVWKGNRRRPMFRLVDQDDPRFADALTVEQLDEYEFRVLARMKRRGDFFTADDFLPAGADPGVAAAAGPGKTVFGISDKEIEGLDAFQAGDLVAILMRGVTQAPQGVIVHGADLERPVSRVVVPSARIVRSSRLGRTILEVDNEHLTRLQAAWAASMDANREGTGEDRRRSHLLAVGLPRGNQASGAEFTLTKTRSRNSPVAAGALPLDGDNTIPSFDSVGKVQVIETLVGARREYHAFTDGSSGSEPADDLQP